jgi:solute:Na+ symporter, SSS family
MLQPIASPAPPWIVLAAFCAVTWWATPRRVTSPQFFDGRTSHGAPPTTWMVAMSAAITWVFAKSIANASQLAQQYGLAGGIGYTLYYLSFVVAGVTIWAIRRRWIYRSLTHLLADKYGVACARLFMLLIAFRLVNEVWSNTKVISLYFGAEGSTPYWVAAVLVTAFTVAYAWRGGMRASLTTDRVHIALAFLLLMVVLAVLLPGLSVRGLPEVPAATRDAGVTFCWLALVQVFSYPFHDPVLTDRGFLNRPDQALRSFLLAALLSGSLIFLFSLIGLYGRAHGLGANPTVSVPASFGVPMLMMFNAIMLMSGGSTVDSTFTSVAKLAGRDWRNDALDPTPRNVSTGRAAILAVALLGNLPLLTIYMGDRIGPAVIAATTISGTMVMGLAPIFLLCWLRPAGALSFHLAFWPGLAIGMLRGIETFAQVRIFPAALDIGTGAFALDLGVNVWGVVLCTAGFLAGAGLAPRPQVALA